MESYDYALIGSFSSVGTTHLEGVSNRRYQAMDLEERYEHLHVMEYKLDALVVYEHAEVVMDDVIKKATIVAGQASNKTLAEVLELVADKKIILTLHLAAILHIDTITSHYKLVGALAEARQQAAISTLRQEIGAKFRRFMSAKANTATSNEEWQAIAADLDALIEKYTGERAVTPQGGHSTPQQAIEKYLKGDALPLKYAYDYVIWRGCKLPEQILYEHFAVHCVHEAHPDMMANLLLGKENGSRVDEVMQAAPEALRALRTSADDISRLISKAEEILGMSHKALLASDFFCLFLDIVRECLQSHPLGLTTLALRIVRSFGIPEVYELVLYYFHTIWKHFNILKDSTKKLDKVEVGIEALSLEREEAPNVDAPSDVLGAISALIGFVVVGAQCTESARSQVLDKLRAINIVVPAARNASALVTWIASLLPDCVTSWFEVVCPESLWMKAFQKEGVEQFLEEVDELCIEPNKIALLNDATMQARLFLLRKKGDRISKNLMCIAKAAPGFYTKIMRKLELVEQFTQHLAVCSGVVGNARHVPYCVYLYGKPGIGKSVATNGIVRLLVPDHVPERMRVYSRVPGADYFDGYMCQWAVVLDDYGQDTKGEDALEFMRMINNVCFLPPMASMDNSSIGIKATPFTSELVIATSNMKYPTSNAINEQQAIWRRRNLLFELQVKPEFANQSGGVDWDKVPTNVMRTLDHLYWVQCDPLNQDKPTTVMSSKEAFRIMRKGFQAHMQHNKVIEDPTMFDDFLHSLDDSGNEVFHEIVEEPSVSREAHADMDDGGEASRMHVVRLRTQQVQECKSEEAARSFLSVADSDEEIAFFDASNKTTRLIRKNALTPEIWRSMFTDGIQSLQLEKLPRIKAAMQSVEEGFKAVCDRVTTFNSEHPWIATCIAGVSLVASLFGVIALLWSTREDEHKADPNMANPSPGDVKVANAKVHYKSRREIRENLSRKTAASGDGEFIQGYGRRVDNGSTDKIAELLHKNQVFVEIATPKTGGTMGMAGFMLCNNVMLTLKHLFYANGTKAKNGDPMFVTWRNKRTPFFFDEEKLYEFKSLDSEGRQRDLVAYELPSIVEAFPDRRTQFVSEAYIERMSRHPGQLLSMRNGVYEVIEIPSIRVAHLTTWYNVGNARFASPVTLEYEAGTKPGDCGSLILVADESMQARIVGLHCSTFVKDGLGIGEIITQDDIEELERNFKCEAFQLKGGRNTKADMVHVEYPGHFQPQGYFTTLGSMPAKLARRLNEKTLLRRSILHDRIFKHATEPAPLNPNDVRMNPEVRGSSLIRRGVEKYGKPSGPFQPQLLKEAREFYKQMFVMPTTGVPRKTLSEFEAINGVSGVDYMGRLNMASSTGFGYARGPVPGKAHLFSQDGNGDYTIKDPKLRTNIDERERLLRNGERMESYWVASLKDEKIPMAKVEMGKTRVFSIPPCDYTILCRKYFLAFCAHFYSLNKSSFSAVGCDPESTDWEIYARQLLSNSQLMFDADFKNFDGTVPAEIMHEVMLLINEFYADEATEEEQLARVVLFEELIHTTEISGDSVYTIHGGMPSGCPMTVVINTLVQCFYMYYAYLSLAPPELANSDSFQRSVFLKAYGDDNITSVASQTFEFYNLRTIRNLLLTHGVEVLPASKKEEDLDKHTSLDQITFLKRHFAIVPDIAGDIYVAQMALQTIHELLNWVHDTGDPHDMAMVNCKTAMRMMFFYGKDDTNQLARQIWKEWNKQSNVMLILPSFEEMRRVFLTKHLGKVACADVPDDAPMYDDGRWLDIGSESREAMADSQHLQDLGSNAVAPMPGKVEAKGVTIVSQTGVVQQNASMGEALYHTKELVPSIAEAPWTVETLGERECFLDQYPWTTDSQFVDPLLATPVPHILVDGSGWPMNPLLQVMQWFSYWRGDIVFTFQLNGTKFHQGVLVAYFVPLTAGGASDRTKVVASTMQHVFLNAATSTTAVMRIPFRHSLNYLPTVIMRDTGAYATRTLGQLYIAPFTKLQVSTGASTTLYVSVSYHFEKLQLYVPAYKIQQITNWDLERTTMLRMAIQEGKKGKRTERKAVPNMESIPAAPTQEQESHAKVPVMGPIDYVPNVRLAETGEERYYSLRDILKRRIPLERSEFKSFVDPTMNNSYVSGTILKISDVWTRAYHAGMLSDYLGFYGMLRGSMKFTLCFSSSADTKRTNNNRYFAVFLPFKDIGKVFKYLAESTSVWNEMVFAMPNAPNAGNYAIAVATHYVMAKNEKYPIIGSFGSCEKMTGSICPMAICDDMTPYLNIEIPFTSVSNAYLKPNGYSDPDNDTFDEPGCIVAGCINPSVDNTFTLTSWVSLGDSARAGVFHCVPKLTLSSYTIATKDYDLGADNWTGHGEPPGLVGVRAGERNAQPDGNQISVWNNKIVHQLSNVGTAALPTNITGDKFDTKQEAKLSVPVLGMDKPSWTLNGTSILRQAAPYLSHANNIEPCDVMALYPGTQVEATPELFGTDTDEMTMEYLTSMLTFTKSMDWSTSKEVDTEIGRFRVGVLADEVMNVASFPMEVSMLDVIACRFSCWSGAMRYRLQFVCTGFHTGRVWVAISYGGVGPTTLQEAVKQYGIMVDLGDTMQDITFDVPYRAAQPKMRVSTNRGAYYVATVSLWVVNKLVAPAGVPTTITINVFKGAGPGFNLHYLGGLNGGLRYKFGDDG